MSKTKKKEGLMDHVTFREVPFSEINEPERTERNRDVGTLQAVIRQYHNVSPILLRADGEGKYDVLAGTRRYYACLEENFTAIPAYVVLVTDLAAHSLRVIENSQRVDLPVLEEARQLQALLNYGTETRIIADNIGRSVPWILGRVKLLSLSPLWQDVLATGFAVISEEDAGPQKMDFSKWTPTHFLRIAQFAPAVQDEILAYFLGQALYKDATNLSTKQLQAELQQYQGQLAAVPWDLKEDGLADKEACNKCSMRLLYQPMLFDDEERPTDQQDQCLRLTCWESKNEAFLLDRKAALSKQYPEILLQKSEYRDPKLPEGSRLLDGLYDPYDLRPASRDAEGALPVMLVDGPNAGELNWRTKRESLTPTGHEAQYNADGTRKPATLAERRARIDKRRTSVYVHTLQNLLKKEIEEPNVFLNDCVTQSAIICATASFGLSTHFPDRWGVFAQYHEGYEQIPEKPHGVLLDLLKGVAGQWQELLGSQLNRNVRNRKLLDGIMQFLGLDVEENWRSILEQIPDPKTWKNLNEDGTPKKKGR